MRETLDAIRHLEQVVLQAKGIVLRYGGFYGDPSDISLALVRHRKFPLVGERQLDDGRAAGVRGVQAQRAHMLEDAGALAVQVGADLVAALPVDLQSGQDGGERGGG